MTDKEIIIDGVDVSECSYYSSETYPYTCEVWDNECEAQNCYYKQLKRLEQENAELKKDIKACNTCEHSTKIYGNEIAELKVENERLKEELATYGATGVCEVCSDKANKLADKYLGCLQEIRDRIPKDYEIEQWYEDVTQLITKAESEG